KEGLWFQTGMVRDVSFAPWSTFTRNHIIKWFIVGGASEAACLPSAQALADGHFCWEWLAENAPRFVATLSHRRNAREFRFRILGAVATTECANQADQLAPKFQTR